MEAELIEKEEVVNHRFVDVDKKDTQITREKLVRALKLGNDHKGKTKIYFLTEDGPKKIETTIWTLSDSYIQIKSSVSIPIKSLIDLKF